MRIARRPPEAPLRRHVRTNPNLGDPPNVTMSTISAARRAYKAQWARNHPGSVQESNRKWRLGNADHIRRQARERMRRWRAKQRATAQRISEAYPGHKQ